MCVCVWGGTVSLEYIIQICVCAGVGGEGGGGKWMCALDFILSTIYYLLHWNARERACGFVCECDCCKLDFISHAYLLFTIEKCSPCLVVCA